MGLFDGFASAFANDDTLGARDEYKATEVTVTWKGPKPEGAAAMFGAKQPVIPQQAIAGNKIFDLAERAKIPIKYSCMTVRVKPQSAAEALLCV